MRLKTLWRALISVGVTAALMLSSLTVLSVVNAAPAGAEEPGHVAHEWVSGLNETFSSSAELFKKATKGTNWAKFGKNALKGAAAFGIVAGILGPLLSTFIASDEPTNEDVLNKLDEMTKQLDQIQEQLTQIHEQITTLQTSVENLSNQVANANCGQLRAQLVPAVTAIESAQTQYQTGVLEASALLAKAGRFGSGYNIREATKNVQEQFSTLATTVLGGTNLAASQNGLSKSIDTIHNLLVLPTSGVGESLIQACSGAALSEFQQITKAKGNGHLAWLDDSTYYDVISPVVKYYEEYELEGLKLVQEASYFTATSELLSSGSKIGADEGATVCADAAQTSTAVITTCNSALGYTNKVRSYFKDEWAATGRPYSDRSTVLALSSAVAGRPGTLPATLWARDSTTVDGLSHGTWSDTKATATYDGLTGWRPAGLADFENLNAGADTDMGACVVPTGVGSTSVDVFCWISNSKQFTVHRGAVYWLPGTSSKPVSLPTGDASVQGYFNRHYPYKYTGPAITMRCYVTAAPDDVTTPLACGQDWINRHVVVKATTEGSGISIKSQLDWTFAAGSYPGGARPKTNLRYLYWNPYEAKSPDYAYFTEGDQGYYPAMVNQVNPDGGVAGGYPAFFNPTTIKPIIWGPCLVPSAHCIQGSPAPTLLTTPSVSENLYPVLSVPMTASCVSIVDANATKVAVPKLCTQNTSEAPHQADRFTSWINDTFPNPAIESPLPTGAPTIKLTNSDPQKASASCEPAGWTQAPATYSEGGTSKPWAFGKTTELPTTWILSATPGGALTTSTGTTQGRSVNLSTLIKDAKVPENTAFRINCVVTAQWAHLHNTGTMVSSTYEAIAGRDAVVMTEVPSAPTEVEATGGSKSATVHWTVADSHGLPVHSFTITPFLNDVAQEPTTIEATGSTVHRTVGARESWTIKGLKQEGTYRFSVTENVVLPGTSHVVEGQSSALSMPVIPKVETAPLKDLGQPLTPLSPGATTSSTTSTSAPPSPPEHSVTKSGESKALVTFTPRGRASFVDLHFENPRAHGSNTQSFRMTDDGGVWKFTIEGLEAKDAVTYWFTYQLGEGEPIHTTDRFNFTHEGSSSHPH